MRLLGRYFFSPVVDFFAFSSWVPIYLIYLLFFFFMGKSPGDINLEFLILGWVLVDGSHVYSTLLVTIMDKDVWSKTKNYIIGLPILIFFINFSLISIIDNRYLYILFLGYLAYFHFVRQEFGWMKIASRFDQNCSNWLHNIDKFTAYCITIIPITWFTSESNKGFWYEKGDQLLIPDNIANFIVNLYWPIVVIFLLANIYHSFKFRTINLAKVFVFLNTFFGWYMAKVYLQEPRLALWLMIFSHGVPYYFIIFKAERFSQKYNWLNNLGVLKYVLMYLAIALIFYVYLMYFTLGGLGPLLKGISPLYKDLFYSIVAVPQMTHFVLDGIIWKKKVGLVNGIGYTSNTKNNLLRNS